MAELHPADFGLLVTRAFLEYERQQRIFDLPDRKFHRGRPGFDLGVRFHGQPASNGLGPAAGPQTQLAQNIVLSWLAGARIFELKTVQINDRLEIPRPCIDATNVGYNVEWSQELRIEESLETYVAAHMLLEMLQASGILDGASEDETFAHANWVFDLSVGYDLKGIRHPRVIGFLRGMQDASAVIDRLRPRIPDRWRSLRDLPFRTRLAESVTLSTFHGCPSDEIEAISDFLLRELGMHVTIKMNPTLLGADRCEELLHDVLGYDEIVPAREHFDHDQRFEDMVPMVQRLRRTAAERGLGLGIKLTNTLVVRNHKKWFSDDVMYLSGAPLHVLAMNILADVRRALGPELPISFSAGIDARNFPTAAAANLVPITVCTDLLRPGGYGRLPGYLSNLENEMERLGVRHLGDYMLRAEHHGEAAASAAIAELGEAVRRASASTSAENAAAARAELDTFLQTLERQTHAALRGSPYQDLRGALRAVWRTRPALLRGILRNGRETTDLDQLYARMVELAGARNVESIVERVTHDPRYAADRNRRTPRKIGSQLQLYDCINCDKCIPVCPNDANFAYPATTQDFAYDDYVWDGERLQAQPGGRFVVAKEHQIANYADFCNECGNCDVFCPEDGGPYIEKPRFFSSLDTWSRDRGVGFHVRLGHQQVIWGRFEDGSEHMLQVDPRQGGHRYRSAGMEIEVDPGSQVPRGVRFPKRRADPGTRVTMRPYHVLRTLLAGVLDPRNLNYINTAAAPAVTASDDPPPPPEDPRPRPQS